MRNLAADLLAFVADRHPFATPLVQAVVEKLQGQLSLTDAGAIDAIRNPFKAALESAAAGATLFGLPDPLPGVTAAGRLEAAHADLVDACDGFLARAAIAASLTAAERR